MLVDQQSRDARDMFHVLLNRGLFFGKSKTNIPKKVPVTDEELRVAASGILLDEDQVYDLSRNKLFIMLKDAYANDSEPGIHHDSITNIANQSAEAFGLTIADIQAMKPGETMDVIFFDRNVGDYLDGELERGERLPLISGVKRAASFAKYTHGNDNLMGKIDFVNYGEVNDQFQWELNRARAVRPGYWGPLQKNESWSDFHPNTHVGWRGPAVRVSDLKKLKLKYMKHYGNYWNDYGVVREYDLTEF